MTTDWKGKIQATIEEKVNRQIDDLLAAQANDVERLTELSKALEVAEVEQKRVVDEIDAHGRLEERSDRVERQKRLNAANAEIVRLKTEVESLFNAATNVPDIVNVGFLNLIQQLRKRGK